MADDSRSDIGGPMEAAPWSNPRPSTSGYSPSRRPYQHPADSESEPEDDYSRSATNQNVVFGRRSQQTSGPNDSRPHNGHFEGRPGDHNEGYEDDDSIIGYGFEGAGVGGPVAPILDLSPVQTTTLL